MTTVAGNRIRARAIEATLGFAADDFGAGVAYVDLRTAQAQRIARVDFRVKRIPSLLGREVGFAAVTAVAKRLADSGFQDASFRVGDPHLVDGLEGRAEVPPALGIAYVNLRCQLNRFRAVRIRADEAAAEDLAARARAEATLHVAA